MNTKWLAALLCLLLLLSPVSALAGALPSGIQDEALESAVDAFAAEHADTTAAASVGVARGGQTLLLKAYGQADIADGRAADLDTVYEWGSTTKLLVWASVMQLVEQGKIDLEADIAGYLPEGFLSKLSYDAPLTMLNLMHHNAGFEDVLIGVFVSPNGAWDDLERELRGSQPSQIYAPGTVAAYSNWGVALAGLIVERVSGQPFYAYVQQHIFEKLGMEHTALSPSLQDNPWVLERRALVQGYAELEPIGNRFAIPLYPAGMATGTVGDFLKFAQALVPDGQSPLFEQPDTLGRMLTPSLLYQNGDPRNAHGFWVIDFAVPLLGHGGNTAAFSSYLLIHKESRTAFVVMTNQSVEEIFNAELPALIFGKYAPKTGGALPDIRDLRGLYRTNRLAVNGCAKLYGAIMMVPLLGGDENTLSTSIFGQSVALHQVSPGLLVQDESAAIELSEAVHVERMEDGGAQLSMPYFGFIRIPTGEGVWTLATLLLLALALLWFLLALTIGLIRRLALRIRGRKGETSPLRKHHYLMCLLGLGEGANIAWLTFQLMTYAGKFWIGVSIALTWLFALLALGYVVLLLVQIWRLPCNRKEKAMYVMTAVASLLVVLNIWQWELYRF